MAAWQPVAKAPLHSTGHAALTTWGCAPNPRRSLAGTPLPRAASAVAHCVRLGGRLLECSSSPFLTALFLGHAALTTWGCAPNPRRSLAGTPLPRAASAVAHCVRLGGRLLECSSSPFLTALFLGHAALTTWGCAPNPRRSLAGTPLPRAASAVAHCVRLGGRLLECSSSPFLTALFLGHAALTTWGCAPNPRRSLAGTPLPRAASAVAHCVRLRGRLLARHALSAERLTALGATRGFTTGC